MRQTFERAITAVGIHVTQGCLIWEAYREFETAYLQFLKVFIIHNFQLIQLIFKHVITTILQKVFYIRESHFFCKIFIIIKLNIYFFPLNCINKLALLVYLFFNRSKLLLDIMLIK